jgi:hypothetical protein
MARLVGGLLIGLLASVCPLACDGPAGLLPSPPGDGPQVIFDFAARPFPEIPFPCDLATRPDPSSATGRRINASLVASTGLERSVRKTLDGLDGFGTYAPISVSFDDRLDLDRIRATRHDDSDRSDDQVLVVVVDPDSAHFGEAAALDLGRGYFPVTLELNDNYFASDPRWMTSNLLFDTQAEDLDADGLLDPTEDSDSDGVLDQPNVYPGSVGDPYRDLVDFYDLQTDTLLIRPVVPLRERTRYAVVLTHGLRGADGQPVRSPFAWVHHLDQLADLRGLADALARNGRDLSEVAFAWSFTTMSVKADLQALRDGLWGQGPFARLAAEFPPEPYLHQLRDQTRPGEQRLYAVEAAEIEGLLLTAGRFILPLIGAGEEALGPLLDSYQFVDYFVSGSFRSPYLLDTADEIWDVDARSGRLNTGEQEVTFWLSVPRAHQHTLADGTRIEYKPPFPVVVYVHGSTSTRLESLGWAGTLGRYGFAVLGIDAVGHGISFDRVSPDLEDLIETVFAGLNLSGMYRAIKTDRARDLNGDGWSDSGGDFWSADIFHTRDVIRQTALDLVQAVRMLRSFDGQRTFAVREDPRSASQIGPLDEQVNCSGRAYREGRIQFTGDVDCDQAVDLAGDFNGDGQVDVGGPDSLIVATGVSLGGIVTALATGLEPEIQRAAPIAGGGGLSDIAARSLQSGVVEAVFMKLFGPLIVGVPVVATNDEPVEYDDPTTRKTFHARFRIDQIRGIWAASDAQRTGRDYSRGAIVKDRLVTLQSPPEADVALVIDYDAVARPELGELPPGPVRLRIEYDLYNVNKELRLTIADDVDLRTGDRVRLTNLSNGEQRTVTAGPLGRFRVAVAADSHEDLGSQDPLARREALLASDRLRLELLAPDGQLRLQIDALQSDLVWHGTDLNAGDPLLALVEGFGLERNTPDLRRMVQLSQIMLEPADPANWVANASDRLLLVLTIGDMNVPINTGIALARSAGLLRFDPLASDPVPVERRRADQRTEHQVLFDLWVPEGLEKLDRFPEQPGTLADPDDLDDGADGFDALSPDQALRATRYDPAGRPVAGVRFGYLLPTGQHGFRVPAPTKDFDIDSYLINQMARFFQDGWVEDSTCLEDYSCDFIPRTLVPLEP